MPTEIATEADRDRCVRIVDAWAAARLDEGSAVVAVNRDEDLDRWYIRLAGEEKEFVTVWLTLRQRTLHHEAQFMPAPESNVEKTFEYLLRRNASLRSMSFSLGPEDAIYLVGEIPVATVDEDELDRVIGSCLAYVDECFPTAMAIGFAGRYLRPRR